MNFKLFVLVGVLVVLCELLTSCYAVMRADRFVYSGSIAKRSIVVDVDSTSVSTRTN